MVYMVQAIINIDDNTNRILNIIKAKYGLKDKSAAINKMAEEYEEMILEPELKPEYIEKLRRIQKQEVLEVGTVENLRKRYGL
jgi:Zn-dependent M32 family carboxypeptidase